MIQQPPTYSESSGLTLRADDFSTYSESVPWLGGSGFARPLHYMLFSAPAPSSVADQPNVALRAQPPGADGRGPRVLRCDAAKSVLWLIILKLCKDIDSAIHLLSTTRACAAKSRSMHEPKTISLNVPILSRTAYTSTQSTLASSQR